MDSEAERIVPVLVEADALNDDCRTELDEDLDVALAAA